MKISPNQIRISLLALIAFSMTKAEVSADILSDKTLEQTNSEESFQDSTTDSIYLMRQLSLQEKVGQMGQGCPAISDLDIPAYNWWSEGTNGYQAPDAYFVNLPPAQANDPGVTVFPQAIALAATWDPVLHQQVGEVTSTEARERYNWYTAANKGDSVHDTGVTIWAPNINIFRDPRWGRGQETYGEDPYLTGTMATAYVKGLQGSYPEQPNFLRTVATLKHFAVHSGPELGRRAMNAVISEHDLRETYLPAFEAGIRIGKAQSIMSSYNAIGVTGTTDDAKNNPVGGIPAPANSMLLTDILRKEWGFSGAVVSDVGAITAIWQDHHFEDTPASASIAAIKAGNDLCGDGSMYNSILDPNSATGLVKGITVKTDIDPALLRLLTLRFRLGLFDPSSKWPSDISTDPHDAVARTNPHDSERIKRDALALKAAEESLVLLKNDFAKVNIGKQNSALPWEINSGETIAVIGPTMDILPAILGDYSGFPINPVTILQGITDYFTKSPKYQPLNVKIVSEPAVSLPDAPQPKTDEAGIQRAVGLVKTADHVVLVLGLTTHLEREESGMVYEGINNGDRTTLELPLEERKLLASVKEACAGTLKSLTVVLTSGGGLAMDTAEADAIMQAWYCGSQGGTAVAEALAGDINPSGKLPITFYAADGDLPKFEDYAMAPHPALQAASTTPAFPESKGRTYRYFTGKPEYAFGYGLSYTTFRYYPEMSIDKGSSAIMTPKDTRLKDDPKNYVNVSVTIANTGPRAGTEIVELYATPSLSCPSPLIEPKQKLVGFQRCMLGTNEVKKLTIPVNLQDLRRWDDTTHKYKIDSGTYQIYARSSSDTPNEKSASCRVTLAAE
jgi:beta-glucosidase